MAAGGGIGPEAKAPGKAGGYADGATRGQEVERPAGHSIMSTPATGVQEWRDIPWPKVERHVHKLQRRIYRASQRDDGRTVHRLQRLLLSSWSAKGLAVRRVTQDNQGKRTAGGDGLAALEPEERPALVSSLSLDAKPHPIRRVWIPKPGTDEQRPLGIPTIADRACQALVKLALEPEGEARFEPNSYGFRPGRSCHDAVAALFQSIKQCPKYVPDADIAKCFDRIDREALLDKLNTFPRLRRIIKGWLEAGVLDGGTLFPTEQGTPQGESSLPSWQTWPCTGWRTGPETPSRRPRRWTARSSNGHPRWSATRTTVRHEGRKAQARGLSRNAMPRER